jgi:Ca-activated chloride channel family protein
MFHFAEPRYLLLALLVPPLVWWQLRQRRASVRHPTAGLLASLPPGRARVARWGGALLRGLAMLLLAVALAGPRWPDLRTPLQTEGIAVMMVLDVSGSMAEPDFDWNGVPCRRLDAAKRVFRLFVAGGEPPEGLPDGPARPAARFEGRPTDQVGLVTFGSRARTVCPLTLSHPALLALLAQAEPVPGEAETNLSDAVVLGLDRLRSAGPRRKVLVVLTDGEHNRTVTASGWTPTQVTNLAASLGVPVYAVDTGPGPSAQTPGDVPPEVRQAAVQTLQDLAGRSKGSYLRARDTGELLDALARIDRLERTRIESFQYRRYHEGYPWCALASFVLFLGAMGMEMTFWRRLP